MHSRTQEQAVSLDSATELAAVSGVLPPRALFTAPDVLKVTPLNSKAEGV